MKTGKYIPLGYHNDIKIGYGTVDHRNLKTIYITLNSWMNPKSEDNKFDDLLYKTRRKIISRIYQLKTEYFKKESIVDLDVRTNGIKLGKKTFLNLEITLFTQKMFDIRSKESKSLVTELIKDIIDDDLNDKILFNFSRNKK